MEQELPFPRMPLEAFPIFREGNFDEWFGRIELALETYPEGERVIMLCSRLGGEALPLAQMVFRGGCQRVADVAAILTERFHENPKPEPLDRDQAGGKQREMPPACDRLSLQHWPLFNGGDFRRWWERLSPILETFPSAEKGVRLWALLGEEVRRFLGNRLGEGLPPFDDMLSALKGRYGRQVDVQLARERLYQRVQRPSELLGDFEGDVRRLAGQAYPDIDPREREELVIHRVIAGLQEVGATFYLKRHPPQSMQELEDVMADYAAITMTGRRPNQRRDAGTEASKGARKEANDELPRALKSEQPEGAWVRRSMGPTVRVGAAPNTGAPQPPPRRKDVVPAGATEGRADNGMRGEAAVNSRPTRRGEEGFSRACFQCGQEGHFQRNCPRRQENC